LEVAALPSDVRTAAQDPECPTTHLELDPTNMLSLIASLTPFSDYNQGPRIMYQCQMGKQTMGTPVRMQNIKEAFSPGFFFRPNARFSFF
jgi:DNA-directed RNA polymerase I subunit RPA2